MNDLVIIDELIIILNNQSNSLWNIPYLNKIFICLLFNKLLVC